MNQCKCNSDNDNPHFSDKEIFEIALKARDFEIRMFWQRCNYFLLLNTSVGAAVGAVVVSDNASIYIIPFLCIIGACVCLAWINVGLGAKFWQVYWEQVVSGLQEKVGLLEKDSCEKYNIFGKYEDIKWRVEKKFKGEKDSWDSSIASNKPSVSRWMHLTARFFFLVWVLAFASISSYLLCILF